MLKRRLLAFAISLAMILAMLPLVTPAVLAASGNWEDNAATDYESETSDTITISAADQLAHLAAMVNAGTDYSGHTITLTSDIDLSAHYWNPIGLYSTGHSFSGTFDGNGYTISGLTIDLTGERHVGLFGYVVSATIKNVEVDGSLLTTCTTTDSNFPMYVGGLAGYIFTSVTLLNCSSSVDVTAVQENGNSVYAGGLVGSIIVSSSGTMTNCYATGSVTIRQTDASEGSIGAYYCGGGLCGAANDQLAINNSYATGDVSVTATYSTSSSSTAPSNLVGGFIGACRDGVEIYNCYSCGTKTSIAANGKSEDGEFIGRISDSTSEITNCYYLYENSNGYGNNKNDEATITSLTGLTATEFANEAVISSNYTNGSSSYIGQYIVDALNLEATNNSWQSWVDGGNNPIFGTLTYTVTFDSNGGTSVASYTAVANNSTIAAPTEPTYTGYTFAGWYTDTTYATAWDFTNNTVTSDMTLVAKWTANNHWINSGHYDTTIATATAADITITTEEELAGLIVAVNSGINYSGCTVTLGADLDLSQYYWTPIGIDATYYFAGTFDGGDCTITGLTFLDTDAYEYYGLFGYTSGATVKNLNISGDISITEDGNTPLYFGSLVGYAYTTAISEVTCSSNIAGTQASENSVYGGGLVGYLQSSSVTSCSVSGAVTALQTNAAFTITGTINGEVGGICGRSHAGTISASSATGDVTLTVATTHSTTGIRAGGAVGYLYSSSRVVNSFATGDVTSTASLTSTSQAGGFIGGAAVGANYVRNCYCTGDINIYDSNAAMVGGFVGNTARTQYFNSYSSGSISLAVSSSYAGGFMGRDAAGGNNVTDCYYFVNAWTGNTIGYGSQSGTITTLTGLTADQIANDVYVTSDYTTDAAGANTYTDGTFYIVEALNSEADENSWFAWLDGGANPIFGCRVSFETYSGTEVESIIVEAGSTIPAPTEPTYAGHTFGGWYTDETFATAWNFTNDTVTGDTTLYAKWVINAQTVRFETYSGSAVDDVIAEYGSTVSQPADPTYTGYTFGGWYKEDTFATAWDFTNDTVTADITLYAKWTTATHTVRFETYSGSAVDDVIAEYGSTVSQPADPTYTGYTFGGWYKEDTFATAWDFTNDTVTADITLYAKWTTATHTVRFETYSGSAVDDVIAEYGSTVSQPADPTYTGYTFGGWYKEDTFATAWDFTNDTVTADITLYAKWTAVSTGGGTTASRYYVKYDGNGNTDGTAPSSVSYTNGTTVTVADNTGALEKDGYTFDGWNTASDGSGTAYDTGDTFTMGSDTVTLYAQWEEDDDTLYYDEDAWDELGTNAYNVAYRTVNGEIDIVPTSYYDDESDSVLYFTTEDDTYYAMYNFVGFDDISDSYWASDYIWFLSARTVVNGMGDGLYHPEENLTRAQFVKMLASMTHGWDTAYSASAGFADVESGSWYESYINWGVANEIIYGYGNGNFGPDDMITREQMAAMIARYVDYLGYSIADAAAYTAFEDDADISVWAEDEIYGLLQSGIITGSNGLFKPQDNATRAEAATIAGKLLYAIFDVEKDVDAAV